GRGVNAVHRPLERALETAEGVVCSGSGCVDTERDPPHACVAGQSHTRGGGERGRGGRERYPQAALVGVAREREEVASHQWIATVQHENRPIAEAGEVVD